jgi:ribosomal protein S18 acetylase RimI-like enzyme
MSPHPLDNPIWSALTTQHARLAVGNASVLRYPIEFAMFVAMATPDHRSFEALQPILPVGEEVAMFSRAPLAPPREFDVTLRRDILQMIWRDSAGASTAAFAVDGSAVLGPDDVPDMRALVAKTKPGPFNSRTHELGRFLGVRVDGQLAAMVGERLHVDGFTEISAVCSDPDFRGRGFVRMLMEAVGKRIAERGEIPFLHVLADNVAAVSLYEKIGFEVRTPMCLTVLKRAA